MIEEMKGAYPELVERRAFIADRIQREEGRFLETLAKGMALLDQEVDGLRSAGSGTLPGEAVFKLYDTFGFPVDLTADILTSHGIGIDQAGFDSAMEAQRARARAAWKGSGAERVDEVYGRVASDVSTVFQGYDTLVGNSRIRALFSDGKLCEAVGEGEAVEVVVEETPFYAESGGQVGDRGRIATESGEVEIVDTRRPSGDLVVHSGTVSSGPGAGRPGSRIAG